MLPPVIIRSDSHEPPVHVTFIRDVGLYVSVPLLAVGLLGTAFALHTRHKQRRLRARGASLREGRVIVDAKRVAPGLLETKGGENLSIDAAAPLALQVGQRGCVLGDLVRDEAHPVGHDTAYRAPDRPHLWRLLPVSDRYDVVAATSERESRLVRDRLIATVPFAAMTGLAVFAKALSVGELLDVVQALWLAIAIVVGVTALIILLMIVHALTTKSTQFVTFPKREQRARERRARERRAGRRD
jgi:hypothetical protein